MQLKLQGASLPKLVRVACPAGAARPTGLTKVICIGTPMFSCTLTVLHAKPSTSQWGLPGNLFFPVITCVVAGVSSNEKWSGERISVLAGCKLFRYQSSMARDCRSLATQKARYLAILGSKVARITCPLQYPVPNEELVNYYRVPYNNSASAISTIPR